MATSSLDIKRLWGRAAGRCSRSGCNEDLTRLGEQGEGYIVGEMAHIIAQAADGPRGNGLGGDDSYGNLILLCPTHHREVDKAPNGTFSAELLLQWKEIHEGNVRRWGEEECYETFDQLRVAVARLLKENYVTWKTLGPQSDLAKAKPSSNAFSLWEMRRVDKIVPNNRRIMNIVRANSGLLNMDQTGAFAEFANHAESYEDHVYERKDDYPLFPPAFSESFG
jgi:hypothetical protein